MAVSENTVITLYRRETLCKATSGAIGTPVPPITHIAFGSGGADEAGNPIAPSEAATALTTEVERYPLDSVTYPVATTAAYTVSIPAADLAGVKINEAALIDSTGNVCAIRTFYTKIKDPGVVFLFGFNDEF